MEIETRARSQNTWFPEDASGSRALQTAHPTNGAQQRYYDVPMLKRPLWKWEIALYFFFEGVSAGAYVLGTLAETFGKGRFAGLTRTARYLSLLTLLPCPPLLIADLGRPERFHHMLRVWKPQSPMNLGAWALSGYSLPVGLLALHQIATDVKQTPKPLQRVAARVPTRTVGWLGLPFAIVMLSYPGVLLSTTSTPIWSRTRELGALLACSSMSNATASLALALAVRGQNSPARARLEKLETLFSACEGALLTAYLITAGQTANPLIKGRYAKHFWAGAIGVGVVAPVLTKVFTPPPRRKKSRLPTILRSALRLAGGVALKWAITHAGRASAEQH